MENTCVKCGAKLKRGYSHGFLTPNGDEIDTICEKCHNSYEEWFYKVEPLERISEETRPTGEEEWSKKLIKVGTEREWDWYGDSQELIDFISEQLSLAREEAFNDGVEFVSYMTKEKYKAKAILKDIKLPKVKLTMAVQSVTNSHKITYKEYLRSIKSMVKDSLTNQSKENKNKNS